jgi:hypothetical protein
MTDKRLQKLMTKTIEQKLKFFGLIDKLENEYIRRFGENPSQMDDDNFIDTFHLGQGNEMTVEKLTEHAKNCNKRKD